MSVLRSLPFSSRKSYLYFLEQDTLLSFKTFFLFLKLFLQGQSWQFLHVQKFLLLYVRLGCLEYRRKSLERSFSTELSG